MGAQTNYIHFLLCSSLPPTESKETPTLIKDKMTLGVSSTGPLSMAENVETLSDGQLLEEGMNEGGLVSRDGHWTFLMPSL